MEDFNWKFNSNLFKVLFRVKSFARLVSYQKYAKQMYKIFRCILFPFVFQTILSLPRKASELTLSNQLIQKVNVFKSCVTRIINIGGLQLDAYFLQTPVIVLRYSIRYNQDQQSGLFLPVEMYLAVLNNTNKANNLLGHTYVNKVYDEKGRYFGHNLECRAEIYVYPYHRQRYYIPIGNISISQAVNYNFVQSRHKYLVLIYRSDNEAQNLNNEKRVVSWMEEVWGPADQIKLTPVLMIWKRKPSTFQYMLYIYCRVCNECHPFLLLNETLNQFKSIMPRSHGRIETGVTKYPQSMSINVNAKDKPIFRHKFDTVRKVMKSAGMMDRGGCCSDKSLNFIQRHLVGLILPPNTTNVLNACSSLSIVARSYIMKLYMKKRKMHYWENFLKPG